MKSLAQCDPPYPVHWAFAAKWFWGQPCIGHDHLIIIIDALFDIPDLRCWGRLLNFAKSSDDLRSLYWSTVRKTPHGIDFTLLWALGKILKAKLCFQCTFSCGTRFPAYHLNSNNCYVIMHLPDNFLSHCHPIPNSDWGVCRHKKMTSSVLRC